MRDKIRFEQNCAHDEIIYILIILYMKKIKRKIMENNGISDKIIYNKILYK